MSNIRHARVAAVARIGARIAALAVFGATAPLIAQTGPKVFVACYVPLTGTVYRIKEGNLKPACTATHVEFSWTDGDGAVRPTDPAGGDLSGVLSNATVVQLLGRVLSKTPPAHGQVLGWNGSEWIATTLPTGGGVTSHGALTGLLNDDHPQYLLTNGARTTANGFAVIGGSGPIPVSGTGVRLMWYAQKAAFRAGLVQGALWDDANIGFGSTALGFNPMASGDGSTAIGQDAKATGGGSVAIGQNTAASGQWSTAMGTSTTASGVLSTAMGFGTQATGAQSTAMGSLASTNGMEGSFVYGDVSTSGASVTSTAANQFTVRASGGFRFRSASNLSTGCDLPPGSGTWSCTSSRLAKERFENLNGDDVLSRIAHMPIQTWSYRTEPGHVRHVGPTAQDFRAAFGLGNSDEAISLVDIDGINLLGVQTLERRTRELERENAALRARLDSLEAAVKRPDDR